MTSDLPPQPGRPAHPQQPPHPQQPRRTVSPLLIVAAVVAAVLVLGGGTAAVVALASNDRPSSVEDTAERAIDAAEDLDVDAGVRLLCENPSETEREQLEDAIEGVQDQTGEEDPEVSYEITDTEETGDGGTVVVEAVGGEELDGAYLEVEFTIVADGDSYCIDEIQVLDGDVPE